MIPQKTRPEVTPASHTRSRCFIFDSIVSEQSTPRTALSLYVIGGRPKAAMSTTPLSSNSSLFTCGEREEGAGETWDVRLPCVSRSLFTAPS